jgi:AcrR family transcriptional regulator
VHTAPQSPKPASAARQRRKSARPQELLDAALDLFVEKGFAATRSEEVASRAGVAKGTLYLYYPSKEELLKEVVRQHVVNRITEGVDLISQYPGPSADLLATVLHLWWERVGETRASGILKLMMSEARNFPEIADFYVREVIRPSVAMLGSLLQRGIDRGEFRAVNVRDAVHALVAPLLFLVMNKHSLGACSSGSMLDPKAIIEAQIDLVLNGLKAYAPLTSPAPKAKKARGLGAGDAVAETTRATR